VSDHREREEVIVSEHLAELRGRVRLLTWVSGLSWTVLVLFGGLLVSGTLDWMIHFDDPGLRLVIGLSLLIASGVMVWRQLISPLVQPLTTTFLALRIERRFPGLHSRVLSAVEFLKHRLDPKLGSPELQQAVVGQALRDLEKIEPSDIVETKSVQRVTFAGAALCAVVATIVLLHPLEAATSVKRLMFPFAECPWPRKFELKLVYPDLKPVIQAPDRPLPIARGGTLELYVINQRGGLPERVLFERRFGDDPNVEREPLRQTTLRDASGHAYEAAVISWNATRGPVFLRATGGDDDTMPFLHVDVVQPPTLQSLRVTVTPPKYSGRPAETQPQGVGHVQGLLGTEVAVAASSDKLLKSARLRIGDKPGQRLTVAEDGLAFAAQFTITEPGVTGYWFELTDTAGFTDPEAPRFELKGIADAVPEVAIEAPVADVLLAPDAELMVKILAKDDLGLREVRITYQLNDDPATKSIPLVKDANNPAEPLLMSTPDHLWKLAEMSLEPGARIVFRAEATDGYDLADPHVGKSTPRSITIVSKEEKKKELAGRVGGLLEDLQQATALQQRAREQTSELQTQLNTAGELRMQDIDQLHRIELDQRQTASRLNHPADGVQSQARQLQDEFLANKLDDPETQQRLSRIIDELSQLGREQFPEIESALTRAAKQVDEQARRGGVKEDKLDEQENGGQEDRGRKPDQSAPPKSHSGDKPKTEGGAKPKTETATKSPTDATPSDATSSNDNATKHDETGKRADPPALDSSLKEAHSHQSRALDKLQELQDLLAQWRDQRDVSRELNSLIAEQDKLQKESSDLGQQTLSKSAVELSPQEKADLGKMAARQRKIAEQVEQFRKQLDQAAESLKPRDPDAAEKFEQARDELSSDGTSGKLREAAQDIGDNKIGEAAKVQQQALDDLRDLDKQLKREPTDDLEMLVKQVEESKHEFETLRKEQDELKEQAKQAAGQPNSPQKSEQLERLRQRQQKLGEKLAEAERKLERLRLRQPTEAAERAQERLDRVDEMLQDPDQADEAAEQMQEIVDDLEQVERDLAQEKRFAQERLAVEQLEKIEDRLNSLLTQQQGVITETERLEVERKDRGSLTRGQLRTLRDLAEVERGLQGEAEEMEKSLQVAEVFSLVLRRTARSLKLSADRMADKQTDAAVVALQRDAVKKIESLLAVLKPDEKPGGANAQQPPMPPEGEQGDEPVKPQEAGPPGESLPQLAQLKLLKAMQQEFLERTQLLDGLRDKDGKLPPEAEKELQELATEQSELADLTRNMITKILQNRPDKDDEPKDGENNDGEKKVPDGEKNRDKPEPLKVKPDKLDLDDLDKLPLDDDQPRKRKEE
jgi:hypothetical protein